MAAERVAGLLIELATSSEENRCSSTSDAVIFSSWARCTTFLTSTIAAVGSILRDKKVRIEDYVDVVLPRYSVDDFKSRFRLSRESFEKLVAHMTHLMVLRYPRQKISTEKKLLVYLKYIATQLHYQAIADIFGICETTVHDIVYEVSHLISSELLNQLVTWPSGLAVQTIEKGFNEKQGFPGVIGAIDGSHISVKTPLDYPENYINRKGFPSLILQAVCDHNMRFIDIYCGWPGSVHDARVLRNSPLCQKAETNMEAAFPNDTHLLGDAAYPIAPWLLVPFKDCGNLTTSQKLYNYKHSSTRMVIERAFGALKGRFRRLKFIDIYDFKTIVHIVMSCCAIHQLCLDTSEDLQDYITEGTTEMEEVYCWDDIMGKSKNGLKKRNAIVELLSNQQ